MTTLIIIQLILAVALVVLVLLQGSDNEGLGLVHRSPHTDSDYKRLYVTIDFGDLYRSMFNN